TVLLAKPAKDLATREARTNFERLGPGVEVVEGAARSERLFKDADLIVDALLGIGVHGEIREPYATLIREMNSSGKPILSVDVPSGFQATPTVRATVTAAPIALKEGMTEATAGQVRGSDIWFP